jgi:pyruvate dehydrogenase E1 component beta subunit
VVVEEGWRSYGVGAEVTARIYEKAFDYVDAPVRRVAQQEVPLPYNRRLEQHAAAYRSRMLSRQCEEVL